MGAQSGELAEQEMAEQNRKRLKASRGVLVLSILGYCGGLVGLYLLPDEFSR